MEGKATNPKRWIALSLTALVVALGVLLFGPLISGKESGNDGVPSAPSAEPVIEELLQKSFPVITRQPETPTVLTGKLDSSGQPETVSCRTCHDTQTPDPLRNHAGTLEHFHQGLSFQHGSLACLSCHSAKNYDTLTLANGQALPYRQTMQLCAQCHGPQFRDYSHGSHGGMTGYWDLTRGSRTRNHCIDCHDPHSPAYPQVRPVFPPQPAERH